MLESTVAHVPTPKKLLDYRKIQKNVANSFPFGGGFERHNYNYEHPPFSLLEICSVCWKIDFLLPPLIF